MAFEKVLIAIDESPIAAHALETGLSLASRLGAEIGIVHAVDTRMAIPGEGVPASAMLADLRMEGRRLLDNAAAKTGDKPKAWCFLKEGNPQVEVVGAAKEWGAALIVIGSHGRSGVKRILLGSTAEHVLRHASCPVLVVKAAEA